MLKVSNGDSCFPKFVKEFFAFIVIDGVAKDGIQFNATFETGNGKIAGAGNHLTGLLRKWLVLSFIFEQI